MLRDHMTDGYEAALDFLSVRPAAADLGKDKLALPRPSLYRYVLPSASGDGEPPRADFAGVPTRHVYTVHLHHADRQCELSPRQHAALLVFWLRQLLRLQRQPHPL